MPGQTFYKNKPYVFVPFISSVDRKPYAYHHNALTNECGILQISITAKSPLHFGQGRVQSIISGDQIYFVRSLCREGNQIALPGSSFKGMLRSFYEAVTHSCVLLYPDNDSIKTALPFNSQETCSVKNMKICPACSVFGRLGYKGKLSFSSFHAKKDSRLNNYIIPQLQSPFTDYPDKKKNSKPGYGNERLYYAVLPSFSGTEAGNLTKEEFAHEKSKKTNNVIRFYGRKFYKHASFVEEGNDPDGNTFECLEPGAILEGKLWYQGLSKEELAALAFALGMGWREPIYHKLGYAKPAYFGSVSISVSIIDVPDRYNGIIKTRDIASLRQLAEDYRAGLRESDLDIVKMFEEIWTTLDEPSQWYKSDKSNNIKVY